jgi:hypothetical protein
VPLVAARLLAVALTGFLSGVALGDLLAVADDVFGGQTRWVVLQSLGQLSAEPLALFPTHLPRPLLLQPL